MLTRRRAREHPFAITDADVDGDVAMMDCSDDNDTAGAHVRMSVVPNRGDSAARGQVPLADGQAARRVKVVVPL